jgi:hypothetical protein
LDILKAFESHVKALERSFNDKRQSQKSLKARKERQNRDAYVGLLKELRAAGKLRTSTKWKDLRELLKDDPRYVAMLGQPGSSPLELFWDLVQDEERALRAKRNDALDVLEVSTLYTFVLSNEAGKTIRNHQENVHRGIRFGNEVRSPHRRHRCGHSAANL